MNKITIDCNHVSKILDGSKVVDDFSLTFLPGITYLIGANGSGKSSLLQMLTTVIPPTEGTIVYFLRGSEHLFYNRKMTTREVRQIISYVPQFFIGYPEMSVKAYLFHQALQRGIPTYIVKRHMKEWLTSTDLWSERKTKLFKLSGGQRQRLGLLQALIGNPRICILDEPFEGLDIMEAMFFRQLIQKLAMTSTIVMSTHRLEWIDPHHQDRVIQMEKGRMLYAGIHVRTAK